jgi:hypothetical protein
MTSHWRWCWLEILKFSDLNPEKSKVFLRDNRKLAVYKKSVFIPIGSQVLISPDKNIYSIMWTASDGEVIGVLDRVFFIKNSSDDFYIEPD